MKCEGCPLREKNPDWCSYFGLLRDREPDCHLTPDHQRIIDAMTRGVFDCRHCWHGTVEGSGKTVYCVMAGNQIPVGCFCDRWQEHEEGEDG